MQIKSPWAVNLGWLGFRFYCWRNGISLRVAHDDRRRAREIGRVAPTVSVKKFKEG